MPPDFKQNRRKANTHDKRNKATREIIYNTMAS